MTYIGNDLEGSSHDHIEVLALYFLGGTEKNHKNCQDIQCHIWDVNSAPPKYESGMLLLYQPALCFPCNLVYRYKYFTRPCYLHCQDRSSKTVVKNYHTTWNYIPEDHNLSRPLVITLRCTSIKTPLQMSPAYCVLIFIYGSYNDGISSSDYMMLILHFK
jgi:hypothetical protein